jgi:hypothetical protein
LRRKFIRYPEGQWFAVPLRQGGYALGIIVRGSSKTKGGLGYFFGPKYVEVPVDEETWNKLPEDAILVGWFGDLGIASCQWPLIQSTRPFSRDEWPIPKFGRKFPPLMVMGTLYGTGKGIIVEFGENPEGVQQAIRETPVDEEKIAGLPEDCLMMGGSVEIRLTRLLDPESG